MRSLPPKTELVAARPLQLGDTTDPRPEKGPSAEEVVTSLNEALNRLQDYFNKYSTTFGSVLSPTTLQPAIPLLKATRKEIHFWEKIQAHPDNAQSRLEYADWLHRIGFEEVADYIRLANRPPELQKSDPVKVAVLSAAALAFWQRRFESSQVVCDIAVSDLSAAEPDLQPELAPGAKYRRELVRGLPTRVIISGRVLLDLFLTSQQNHPLWLASELWVSCNPFAKKRIGCYGQMWAQSQARQLSSIIEELLKQSQWVHSSSQIQIVR